MLEAADPALPLRRQGRRHQRRPAPEVEGLKPGAMEAFHPADIGGAAVDADIRRGV